MRKKAKWLKKAILAFVTAFVILMAVACVNHQIKLNHEKALRVPLGKLVDVNGHKMSIYVEGDGAQTIVFMSGGGTCSPILDFKSLYSTLTDQYKIVVVEKFGYGFSDVVDKARDIDSILEDTRTALAQAELKGPYVLCPHSMSGIEALYWAQQYPDEVDAIIGLDMAVPKAYEDYKINMPMLRLSQFAARIGVTRFLPGISESDAIRHGTLTDTEKEIYRALFFDKTATTTMMNEVKCIKENAEIVQDGVLPQIPMLMFVSNGVGTGWGSEVWHKYQSSFIENVENGKLINLDCPHYVHDYEYKVISEMIKGFLLGTYDQDGTMTAISLPE